MKMADSKPQNHSITVRVIDDLDSLEDAHVIRRRVFHQEQNVDPQYEEDDLDEECIQFMAYSDGNPAGTCRLFQTGPFIKMQRLAVDSQYRGQGIGSAILNSVADYVRTFHPDLMLVAVAQIQAVRLYEKAGWTYVEESKVIYEQNIVHKTMILIPEGKEGVDKLILVQERGQDGSEMERDVLKRMAELNLVSKQ